ncbi:MAG: DNA-formamidopyrimidine glycosylase [Bacilli bacterium]
MPELPEVATVIKIIKPLITNKIITSVDVFFDRLVQSDLTSFKKDLIGKTILNVSQYGKYIFIHLSNDFVLITHLRMEGKFRYSSSTYLRNKYTTALFYFNDGSSLGFDDTRKFGIMYLSKENEYKELKFIKKLGVIANNIKESDLPELYEKFNNKKPIKEVITDQSVLCGIGNIYADEILYDVKINPLTQCKDLSQQDIKNICISSNKILNHAIELGGSTIHSFHPSEGVDGKFQIELKCYGREGQICPNCGTKFHKIFLGGRGTTFCPNCQINKNYEKAIGITGPIGSGKTTVLEYFKDKNYLTISCDEEIHKLYEIPMHKNKISKILNIPFDINNKIITQKAREEMIKYKDKKEEVENYIYPILENKLLKIIQENDNVVIEVPLLFKAHFEYMFKKIIVLLVNQEEQVKHLNERRENVTSAKGLNSDFKYDKNNGKIITINNNKTIKELYEKLDQIF